MPNDTEKKPAAPEGVSDEALEQVSGGIEPPPYTSFPDGWSGKEDKKEPEQPKYGNGLPEPPGLPVSDRPCLLLPPQWGLNREPTTPKI